MHNEAPNDVTIKDEHPQPRIEDLFDQITGASVFSKVRPKAELSSIEGTLWNKAFMKYLGKFVVMFIDDILVYSKSDHEDHRRKALGSLENIS